LDGEASEETREEQKPANTMSNTSHPEHSRQSTQCLRLASKLPGGPFQQEKSTGGYTSPNNSNSNTLLSLPEEHAVVCIIEDARIRFLIKQRPAKCI
jgi:hypothetical protein